MCGIVGLIDTVSGSVPAGLLRAMQDSMAYRGPDGEGQYLDGPVGMAMRRLAIIDREGGAQPLTSREGRVVAFQNGEIYNYKDLRRELETLGFRFRSQTDTEVLAHGYAAWGIDGLLERAEGMFALAILDRDRRELHLARDRFGEKPLFISESAGRFAYSSTATALAALPWVDSAWDLLSLRRYLALHYVPGDSTLLRAVRRVLPGERLVVPLADPRPRRHRYYRLPIDRGRTEDLGSLIEEAVASRLVSDVPVGVFLSGGLDSSLIAAIAASRNPRVATFSMGFSSQAHDESQHALEVARAIGSDHHHFTFDQDSFQTLLPRVARSLDEPVGDQALLPLFWLCQEARRHATVVLSGEGADEIFAGYSYYRPFVPKGILGGFPWMGRPASAANGRLLRLIDNPTPQTPSGFPLLTDAADRDRLAPAPGAASDAWEDELLVWLSTAPDSLARASAADLATWLPDDLLVKSDRMTMAHSLEGRAPYLSRAVVEAGVRLPARRKANGTDHKVALRQVARRWIPESIWKRPKQGFVLPMRQWLVRWFSSHGGATNYFCERPVPLLKTSAVSRLVDEDLERGLGRERLIFALVLLIEWYDAFSANVRELRNVYAQVGHETRASALPPNAPR